jgi:hypothetical protein
MVMGIEIELNYMDAFDIISVYFNTDLVFNILKDEIPLQSKQLI